MVSKYYKVSQGSLGNNSLSLFSCIYICAACFHAFSVFNEQITTFENIPPLRREVVVHGDGNYFYRAVALRKDEISDEKHKEIPRSSDILFEKNPKVSELQLLELLEGSCQEKQWITGIPAETVDISSVVNRFLSDQFVSVIVTEERVQFCAES